MLYCYDIPVVVDLQSRGRSQGVLYDTATRQDDLDNDVQYTGCARETGDLQQRVCHSNIASSHLLFFLFAVGGRRPPRQVAAPQLMGQLIY